MSLKSLRLNHLFHRNKFYGLTSAIPMIWFKALANYESFSNESTKTQSR